MERKFKKKHMERNDPSSSQGRVVSAVGGWIHCSHLAVMRGTRLSG